MYCKKCGKEISDDATICAHCGTSVEFSEEPKENKEVPKENKESKTGVGVALGFFLSLIGLIIGFAIYPADTEARKTFKKGWLIGFFMAFGIGFFIGIIRACLLL